jgi:sec-independent protein translocase protein TatC
MSVLGVVRASSRAPKIAKASPNEMSLVQHLAELRRRVVVCVAFFFVAALVAYFAYGPVLRFLVEPLCRVGATSTTPTTHGALGASGCRLYVTSPLDGLSLRIRITVFGALFLASPVIAYQLWRFVTPGLRRAEKRFALPFAATTTVLFATGALTAYEVLPHALGFLESIGGPRLVALYNPISYLGLITAMMVIFGIAFEFPAVLVSLELARVVTSAQLLHWWRWAVMTIIVLAGIFVPSSDPLSMCALAVPLVAFYFLAIGVGRLLHR